MCRAGKIASSHAHFCNSPSDTTAIDAIKSVSLLSNWNRTAAGSLELATNTQLSRKHGLATPVIQTEQQNEVLVGSVFKCKPQKLPVVRLSLEL